jgi:hypothetical protein
MEMELSIDFWRPAKKRMMILGADFARLGRARLPKPRQRKSFYSNVQFTTFSTENYEP